MGPKGSNTPLHLDYPGVPTFHLVVEGKKKFCWCHCNPEYIPKYLRTLQVGEGYYTREEYEEAEQFCLRMGGKAEVLLPGKCMVHGTSTLE